jgi:hypothetical protein
MRLVCPPALFGGAHLPVRINDDAAGRFRKNPPAVKYFSVDEILQAARARKVLRSRTISSRWRCASL